MNKNKKYIVILGDGMADYEDETGNTPLSLAKKPMADALAKISEVGLVQTIPFGLKPGSDTANLSVMGFDPRVCYTGRSPLEAVSIGIKLADTDVTYRANLVTLSDEPNFEDRTMVDYSSGEITTAEAKILIEFIESKLGTSELSFHAGVSYRHCLVRKNGKTGGILTPPHDISGRKIKEYLPSGQFASEILLIEKKAAELLKNHEINIKRREKGLHEANSVWLWGEGTKPKLENFTAKFGAKAAVISAVDLIKGIAISAGMESIDVEGATGTVNTNFDGKAKAALQALKTNDLVYVHLEAPDECGHQGDKKGKIRAIELIDEKIITPIFNSLTEQKIPFNLLFVPDHATPLVKMTHTSDPVPYILYNSEIAKNGVDSYTEKSAKSTNNFIPAGISLMPKLLEQTK